MSKANKKTIFIIGVGPGPEALLTEAARLTIGACRVFVGGERLLRLAPEEAETFTVGSELDAVRRFIAGPIEREDVCVLASGDPGCFSIMQSLKDDFEDRIQVVPGIAAVQLLSARLLTPWHDWRLVSLHGRQKELAPLPDPSRPTVYFCDDKNSPQAIADNLPKALSKRPVAVGGNLGLPDETIWEGRLADAANLEFPGNSLLLVFPAMRSIDASRGKAAAHAAITDADAAAEAAAPGIPDELWLRLEGVPLSKSEVRTVVISKARPGGRRVIWDAGAGTGSYGIECALIEPRARVYAIDKNPEACDLVDRNALRFGAVVETVRDETPKCFPELPQPDLVIIGGNDGRLEEIFQGAAEALAPGGRILVTALLEETKKKAHKLFAESGLLNRGATRVAISRGQNRQWMDHNPVIIFTGDKPLPAETEESQA